MQEMRLLMFLASWIRKVFLRSVDSNVRNLFRLDIFMIFPWKRCDDVIRFSSFVVFDLRIAKSDLASVHLSMTSNILRFVSSSMVRICLRFLILSSINLMFSIND